MRPTIDRFFEQCGFYQAEGQYVLLGEFLTAFYTFLREHGGDPDKWPECRIVRELGAAMPIGYGRGNLKVVGNVSREFRRAQRYELRPDGKIRLEEPHIKREAA